MSSNRYAWLQIAAGKVELNGHLMEAGDGAAVFAEAALTIRAMQPSEVLLFDLA
jgi:redox-sensitive bicupin YhaK (pirin superfamily)